MIDDMYIILIHEKFYIIDRQICPLSGQIK